MYDNMRVSDADREHVVERLREHFAEGRLKSDELDERVTAALSAKTNADLRGLMTDLPEPDPVGAPGSAGPLGTQDWQSQPFIGGGRPMTGYRRGPRILPFVLFALALTLILPGGGLVFYGIFKVFLLFWFVMFIVGIFGAARWRRNVRRHWESRGGNYWRHQDWHHHQDWRR
jgi:hypothetical protein